ncbi:MAG: glycosyltransferase [Eubacteriales bacterium]|nr:glycosyltransferase [Eubacteriales bacterium]
MKITFIVDGGNKAGLGNVYQSISFASLLTGLAKITFLTKSDTAIVNKIQNAGFHVFKLADDTEIRNFLMKNTPDIVIIDKIDASERLAQEIQLLGIRKLVIFSNLTNANKHADIAVTAGIGSNFENIHYIDHETGTLYYYGPAYWIFRKEFHEYRSKKKERAKTVNNILIMFGGSDPANMTTVAVKELLKQQINYTIDVILGAGFGHSASLDEVLAVGIKNNNISIQRDVSNVAELMYKADLVITSPGLSTFEALYVGTPVVLMPQNTLQKETYQDFFKMIDPEEADTLLETIANQDFTYPDQKHIIRMDIGGGTEELIKVILGEEK